MYGKPVPLMGNIPKTEGGDNVTNPITAGFAALVAYLERVKSRADEYEEPLTEMLEMYAMIVYIMEGRTVDLSDLDGQGGGE